jgi:lipopolysaccharide/colanic/teichoic acid biosynthesis glycosyltransferase
MSTGQRSDRGKRLFDIVMASSAMVLLSPLIVALG